MWPNIRFCSFHSPVWSVGFSTWDEPLQHVVWQLHHVHVRSVAIQEGDVLYHTDWSDMSCNIIPQKLARFSGIVIIGSFSSGRWFLSAVSFFPSVLSSHQFLVEANLTEIAEGWDCILWMELFCNNEKLGVADMILQGSRGLESILLTTGWAIWTDSVIYDSGLLMISYFEKWNYWV